MLLSISVHLTMEPKQKEESLDTKIGSDDVSIRTKHFVVFDFVFHLTMCQWHLTKRYSTVAMCLVGADTVSLAHSESMRTSYLCFPYFVLVGSRNCLLC